MPEEREFLIRGGTAAVAGAAAPMDVLVRGERIAAIAAPGVLAAKEEVSADGLLVLPGGVDTHVHFNDVFMNTVSVHDYYTGTLAAAHGGVTSVVDFANQAPGGTLRQALESKHREAQGEALVDWGVHPVVTDVNERTLAEIPRVVAAGAPTIKCYMTYRRDGLMVDDDGLERILGRLKAAGGLLMLHAEDNDAVEENVAALIDAGKWAPIHHAVSRPTGVEDRAIARAVGIAERTGGRIFIVHMATAEGIGMVAAARARGVDVLAETCTHYLVFTKDVLERDDGLKWVCSPPLRDRRVQERLWTGIANGSIALVSSDDAAYSWQAKKMGAEHFDRCPNGIAGIEARIPVLYSEGVAKGRISLLRFVELVAEAPARIFGLAPRKGTLTPGADADIVFLDPSAKWVMGRETLHMATDYSPYEGCEVTGRIVKVFSRGELIVDGDECAAKKGRGRYIHRRLAMGSA